MPASESACCAQMLRIKLPTSKRFNLSLSGEGEDAYLLSAWTEPINSDPPNMGIYCSQNLSFSCSFSPNCYIFVILIQLFPAVAILSLEVSFETRTFPSCLDKMVQKWTQRWCFWQCESCTCRNQYSLEGTWDERHLKVNPLKQTKCARINNHLVAAYN